MMKSFGMMFLFRSKVDGQHKWYKFDDGDVCECNMDDDEVSIISKNQPLLFIS